MNSAMSGLAVLKKPFTWKFGYTKSQKKLKLHVENGGDLVEPEDPALSWDLDASETDVTTSPLVGDDVCWDFCVKKEDSEEDVKQVSTLTAFHSDESQDSSDGSDIYCTITEPDDYTTPSGNYNCRFDNGESGDPLYENSSIFEPFYENTDVCSSVRNHQHPEEHIYEHVSSPSDKYIGSSTPINVVLALLRQQADVANQDHIYQVPLGPIPIYNSDSLSRISLRPPEGFQDYENIILSNEVIYSSVVKPKRKKQRPTLSALLQNHNANNSSNKVTVNVSAMMNGQGEITMENNNETIVDINQDHNDKIHKVFDNINGVLNNGNGKQSVNGFDCESIYENVQVNGVICVETTEDLASVIEISDDGTWETKEIPPTEVDQAKDEQQVSPSESSEFLDQSHSAESVKIKHAALAYGSQYYVNCPVASVKPMKIENRSSEGQNSIETAFEDDRNLGAQIMKQYEQDRQKIRDSKNLPDVSLLDVEASMEDIEKERRRIIVKQAVKAKRIDSWIKDGEEQEEYQENFVAEMQEEQEEQEDQDDNLFVDERPEAEVDDSPMIGVKLLDLDYAAEIIADGEVVCDSILENKHKTKTYWEQMMMAATTSDSSKAQYHISASKRNLLSVGVDPVDDNKPNSDVSELDFYDARSQISLNSPVGQFDLLDDTESGAPKIVETVAKKLNEVDNIKLVKTGESSVIARDIRIQKEKEDALLRDREKAFQKTCVARIVVDETVTNQTAIIMATSAEAKIAQEMREMREREEELRSLRQSLVKEEEDPLVATTVIDDSFNSIPNTDEGNFSEYGSEEKDLSVDGNNSRMMSPEIPQNNFLHQRTQSMDSMSSGHSSGSGSGAQESYNNHNRRRITVKPYEEPDEEVEDELPTYMRGRDNSIAEAALNKPKQLDKIEPIIRSQKETPIEREIRLAREREEELRREQRLPPFGVQLTSTVNKQDGRRAHRDAITNDPRSVQHRLATNRIQQEINEATEREKELRSTGTIQTMSEDTVDSKVTRFTDLAEFSIEEQDRKQLKKAVSTSNIPAPEHTTPIIPKPPAIPTSVVTPSRPILLRSTSTNVLSVSGMGSPRRFGPGGNKGIMERFLLSRGKLTGMSAFGQNSGSPSLTHTPIRVMSPTPRYQDSSPSSLPSLPPKAAIIDVPAMDDRQIAIDNELKEREKSSTPLRKGYTSAEDKIQAELQEMRWREEELRMQRARTFAQSQPNLTTILDDDDDDEEPMMNGDIDSPMNINGLRASSSNPNLLETEENESSEKFQPSNKNARKRNALILQWENRIQQSIVEH